MSEHCTFYILDLRAPVDERVVKAIEKGGTSRRIKLGGTDLLVWTEWIDEVREIFGEQHPLGVDIKECKTDEERIFWPDGRVGYDEWLDEMVEKGYLFYISDEGYDSLE